MKLLVVAEGFQILPSSIFNYPDVTQRKLFGSLVTEETFQRPNPDWLYISYQQLFQKSFNSRCSSSVTGHTGEWFPQWCMSTFGPYWFRRTEPKGTSVEWVQTNGRLLLKLRPKHYTECPASRLSCSVNSVCAEFICSYDKKQLAWFISSSVLSVSSDQHLSCAFTGTQTT